MYWANPTWVEASIAAVEKPVQDICFRKEKAPKSLFLEKTLILGGIVLLGIVLIKGYKA